MTDRELFINDDLIIPDRVLRMTKEERMAEIARLEAEAAAEKERILAGGGSPLTALPAGEDNLLAK